MKKIALITCLIAIWCSGYGQIFGGKYQKPTYPNQRETGKKIIDDRITYFTNLPEVKQIGPMKYIYDPRNKAWILFKAEEDTLLSKLSHHLDSIAMGRDENGKEFSLTPIVIFIEGSVAPLTLFTKKELKKLSKEESQRLIAMSEYATQSVLISEFTYVELLSESDIELLGLTATTSGETPQISQKKQPKKTDPTIVPKKRKVSSVLKNSNKKKTEHY